MVEKVKIYPDSKIAINKDKGIFSVLKSVDVTDYPKPDNIDYTIVFIWEHYGEEPRFAKYTKRFHSSIIKAIDVMMKSCENIIII